MRQGGGHRGLILFLKVRKLNFKCTEKQFKGPELLKKDKLMAPFAPTLLWFDINGPHCFAPYSTGFVLWGRGIRGVFHLSVTFSAGSTHSHML